jgi:hypothetical protein
MIKTAGTAPDSNIPPSSCSAFWSLIPGTGKTAIMLRLAAHVVLGRPLGGRSVDKGKVLYFAGENPDDIRMRWIAMSQAWVSIPRRSRSISSPARSSFPRCSRAFGKRWNG